MAAILPSWRHVLNQSLRARTRLRHIGRCDGSHHCVPVHVVSARAGHARPSVTLDTYSHLLGAEDDDAAKRADDMLRRALK